MYNPVSKTVEEIGGVWTTFRLAGTGPALRG